MKLTRPRTRPSVLGRVHHALGQPLRWPKRTSLRVRLVVALSVLVALALFLISFVGVMAVRSYQLERVDTQLSGTANALAARAASGSPVVDPTKSTPLPLPGPFYIALLSPGDGRILGALRSVDDVGVLPDVRLDQEEVSARALEPFTVTADDGTAWRVVAHPLSSSSLVLAVSLEGVNSTTTRLALLDAGASLLALVLLGVVGSLIVRSNLMALDDVERTAGAIAGGDLSRRVPDGDPRTEVGRLAKSLNTMLTRLEEAFTDRERALSASQASEERMHRFVADASHELRTPLTSVRGFAELAKSPHVDPAQARMMVARIEEEAARMGLLVEDLLALARLDREERLRDADGDGEPEVRTGEHVEVITVALDVLDTMRTTHPHREVDLEFESSPTVVGDPARIHQIVSNLVGNALAYTRGAVCVRLSDGDEVVIEVIDQGPGLSAEDAEHVFERFYRADSSRARVSGGTGLGLSIVKSLAQAHGGRVELETSLAGGSTFRVVLPPAPESEFE